MSRENVEIVKARFGAFDGVNVAEIEWTEELVRGLAGDAYSPDIELDTLQSGLGTGVGQHYEGLDGMLSYLREWFEPFSEYYIENLDWIDAGACVLAPSRQSGIGAGSGAEVVIELTTLYEVRDGKIVRLEQYDTLDEAREAALKRA